MVGMDWRQSTLFQLVFDNIDNFRISTFIIGPVADVLKTVGARAKCLGENGSNSKGIIEICYCFGRISNIFMKGSKVGVRIGEVRINFNRILITLSNWIFKMVSLKWPQYGWKYAITKQKLANKSVTDLSGNFPLTLLSHRMLITVPTPNCYKKWKKSVTIRTPNLGGIFGFSTVFSRICSKIWQK